VRIAFRAAWSSTRNFWVNLLRSFLSWVFCMIVRRDVSVPVDTIWIFELWFFIPRIMFHGPAEPPALRANGLDSSVCCIRASPVILFFELWILIPRIVFWLATPYYPTSHGHRRRYCIQLWALVARLFLIQG
jgi:hypothetical protein